MFHDLATTAERPRKRLCGPGMAALAAAMVALSGCAANDPKGPDTKVVQSRFESDPAGATIFIDGGYVGTTPTSFRLPPKRQVRLRLELPGHFPVDTTLDRLPNVPEGAEPGVGWEEVYYFVLKSK